MKNPLSIEAFAEWCEKQPARKQFNYYDYTNCALGQYAASLGVFNEYDAGINECGTWWRNVEGLIAELPMDTFGALASHLRDALKETGE